VQDDDRQRIALFGGSFDPIHLGHTFLAERAREELELDRVIFIPAHCSPFKTKTQRSPAADRLAMIHLAISGFPWAEASDYEIGRGDTSYSWRTAEHFLEELGGPDQARLFWILGADQWNSLHHWAEPEKISSALEFIVFHRDGDDLSEQPDFRGHFVEGTFDASSTAVRAGIRAGERALPIAASVRAYAEEHGLFR